MTILITGGAGYIGSHTVLAALESGRKVIVADNLSTGHRRALPENIPLEVGDIGDPNFLDQIFTKYSIQSIIHFAGSIIVPESVDNPLKYYHNNTAASRTLIEAAIKYGTANFIFSSTAAVYGDPNTIPVNETAALHPLSPYGTSKWMTELMLADAAKAHNFRYAALRYFNVAGADPLGRTGQSSPNATHLIKVACQAALGGRTHLSIFGTDYETPDGTGIRDYIHVSDLAAAHILSLDYLESGGASAVMNCGYGHGYSVLDVIRAVQKVSGVDFPIKKESRRAGDSPKVVACPDQLKSLTGWVPLYGDIETIVSHALEWERTLKERAS